MPNYVSKIKPDGMGGTEYNIKDAELREVVQTMRGEVAGTQTATGNPITLTDASETYAQGLSVELEPKQDLHGYDFPWVGGAGKNKLPMTVEGIKAANTYGTWSGNVYTINGGTFTILTDNDGNVTGIKANGLFTSRGALIVGTMDVDTSTEYTCDIGDNLNGNTSTYYADFAEYNGISWVKDHLAYGAPVTFTPTSNKVRLDIYCAANYTANNLLFQPMIRLSTETDPTFAPYSNICPISGYEGVEVEDVGFNQWDEEWEVGYLEEDGTVNSAASNRRTTSYIPVIPNTEYYATNDAVISGRVAYYDKNKNCVYYSVSGLQSRNITTPNDAYFMRITINVNYGMTYNHDISINYPSTDTNYHLYQSRTASVTFGQTVYGAIVNFLTGECLVNRGFEVFDGSNDEGWVGRNENKSRTTSKLQGIIKNASSDGVAVNFLKSNMFKKGSADEGWGGDPNIIGVGTDGLVYTSTGETMSISDWTTYLVNNNLQICYELATPFTIQLTPDELKLLQDTNNLTTNGTTINLDYIPNNSIGDAVNASEEYTDRAVERVIPKAKLACFYEIFDESGTLYDANIPEDCNFFLVEYRIQNRIGSTLIKAKSIDFYIPVVVNVGGEQHWVEFLYNSIYHTIDYTSNVTTGFGVLSIYTI